MYALKKVGIEKLREEKDKVIRSFVGGKVMFMALPTGYGKSYSRDTCFKFNLVLLQPL